MKKPQYFNKGMLLFIVLNLSLVPTGKSFHLKPVLNEWDVLMHSDTEVEMQIQRLAVPLSMKRTKLSLLLATSKLTSLSQQIAS